MTPAQKESGFSVLNTCKLIMYRKAGDVYRGNKEGNSSIYQ